MKLGAKKKEKPTAGGEKKAKRKSSRGSGDGLAKLKSFFADHVEKLILGVMALFSLLLIYSGFSKEALQTDPDKVASEVSRAQSSIDSQTWAQVKQERQSEPDRFDQQATQDTVSIDVNAYAMNVPFHPRLQEQGKKRSDPELLAPFEIEVRSGYGALAVRSTGRDASIADVVQQNSTDLRSIPPEMSPRGRNETALGGKYESRFFVAITGLVPYKKQFDLYAEAFKGAAEYNPERDVPNYLGLEIERAEVQPDGSLSDWQPLDTPTVLQREPTTWDGQPDEQADRRYLLPVLNMPLPPLVMRDVSQWSRHSTVPVAQLDESEPAVEDRDRAENGPEEGGQLTWHEMANGRQTESRRGMTRTNESASEESDPMDGAEPALKVDNGMLRYFDFTVQPGKKYTYRVQAVLDDPNNPGDGNVPVPSDASCESDVLVRRQEASAPKLRRTAWSSPSDAVVVPTGQRVLASSAQAPTPAKVPMGGRVVRFEKKATDEPTIKVMTLTWKADGPYDVPVLVEVARGAVLNGAIPMAEAIDPSAARVRALRDYRFATDTMVLDIYGGNLLRGGLASPGYMLVRTADGRLEFHAEMADVSDVEKNTIPPPEEEVQPDKDESPESRAGGNRLDEPPQEGRRSDNPRRTARGPRGG
jgi:hypothetical protein